MKPMPSLEELRSYATVECDGEQCVVVDQSIWFRILDLIEERKRIT